MRYVHIKLPAFVALDNDGDPGSGMADGRHFAIWFENEEAVKVFTKVNNLPAHPQVAILADEAQIERCLRDSRDKGLEWLGICKSDGTMEYFYLNQVIDGYDGHPKAN